uniref:Uncharacterized protein n=1 Tax=Myoviridae sp. cthAo37 TaxID=2827701 RepID=A0A8S5S4P5_9CAUD|nr:MAG TPA: hypothetical protein [Myoviridae sp. cthAo37]
MRAIVDYLWQEEELEKIPLYRVGTCRTAYERN